MKKILSHVVSFIFFFLVMVTSAHAAPIVLENPFKLDGNLADLIKVIIDQIVLPIGGVIAVLMFILTGFKYVTAQGDPGKIKSAHQALLNTSIGTAILMGAWAIANAVHNTVNQFQV